MKPYLQEVLNKISTENKQILAQAHDRYEHLIGLSDTGQIAQEILEQDKIKYAHFIKKTADNLPIFNDNDCIDFIFNVTNFPELWCEAWVEYTFEDEHGSIEELIEWSEREKQRIKFNEQQKTYEKMYFDNYMQDD